MTPSSDPARVSPFQINAQVTITGGPKDVVGRTGIIKEIRKSVSGERKFTIDYEDPKGNCLSVQLSAKDLRINK
jgi:ribosomal protein S4E